MAFRQAVKNRLKKTLSAAGIFLTPNQRYDHYTSLILRRLLRENSAVVDVGCHHGEFLDEVLNLAPLGHHFAIEALPFLARKLEEKYKNTTVTVCSVALGAETGETKFVYVPDAPAYSGLRKREYPLGVSQTETLIVPVKRLDDLLPENYCPHFIKLDVEGGEWLVLLGAESVLRRCRPYVLFEFGRGAADYYGIMPESMFEKWQALGYRIFTLKGFLHNQEPLAKPAFEAFFRSGKEYYFLATP
jgi:FkbM family methyltransferase